MAHIPTPSQTVGPFFAVGLDRPELGDLTRDGARGDKIHIEGQVRDGDGAPVPDAMLEIWQADAGGRYRHPEDRQDKPRDANFLGFGRAFTDRDGRYRFTTIRPGAVPGRGNSLQAPHIVMAIFARGILKHLVTRIYFAGVPANEADPVLSGIDDAAVRQTLFAQPVDGATPPTWRFDVVLQGEGETAFFDI